MIYDSIQYHLYVIVITNLWSAHFYVIAAPIEFQETATEIFFGKLPHPIYYDFINQWYILYYQIMACF